MLRIDWQEGRLPTDFADDYLELVHLLTEAAALEHALMIAYLYSLFSIKDEYAKVRGDVKGRSYLEHSPAGRGGTAVLKAHESFLDVAIEEMQHLSLVNRLLADLGASPNFTPHEFPYTSDLYPFDIALRSLDQYAAATYLWIEADDCALSLRESCRTTGEPVAFVKRVRAIIREGSRRYDEYPIDEEQLSHVGSLYHRIVALLHLVADAPPPFLSRDFPWGDWGQRLNFVMFQGEESHYRFFRKVFTGEAFGSDESIWTPGPRFPAHHFASHTAFTARPHVIPDENARRVAWLSNLHYWMLLALLDLAYRAEGPIAIYSAARLDMQYKAIDNMTMALWSLGKHLADRYSVGVPFDQLGPQYQLGRDTARSVFLVERLVREAQAFAAKLGDDHLLPADFDMAIYDLTLAGMGARSGARAADAHDATH